MWRKQAMVEWAQHEISIDAFQTIYLFVLEIDYMWVLQPQSCIGTSQPKKESNARPLG